MPLEHAGVKYKYVLDVTGRLEWNFLRFFVCGLASTDLADLPLRCSCSFHIYLSIPTDQSEFVTDDESSVKIRIDTQQSCDCTKLGAS